LPESVYAALVGRLALAGLRMQEPFADLIIHRRAEQVGRRTLRMTAGRLVMADLLDAFGFARPLAEPRRVVADPAFEAQPDAVNLVDLRPAPRRRAQRAEHAVRPTVVFRKVHEGKLAFGQPGTGHKHSSQAGIAGIKKTSNAKTRRTQRNAKKNIERPLSPDWQSS